MEAPARAQPEWPRHQSAEPSAAAQGRRVPKERLNTALRWANRLVDNGLDIAYDPEMGFHEVPAGDDSHIARVLAEAREATDAAGTTS